MVSADETHELDMPVRRDLRLLVTTELSAGDPETLPSGPVGYDPSGGEDSARAGIDQCRSMGENRIE